MRVDMRVAIALDVQVHERMLGEEFEHVIKKPDPGLDRADPFAIDRQRQADLGLAGLALDRGFAYRGWLRLVVQGDAPSRWLRLVVALPQGKVGGAHPTSVVSRPLKYRAKRVEQ